MIHGGSCLARSEGRVVLVRSAIPGERVRVRLLEAGDHASFWRAEVIEVLRSSPDRRPHPWRAADALAQPPGHPVVGGADYGHITDAAQRRLKAEVFAETLQRMGVSTEANLPEQAQWIPGSADQGTGWRSRVRFDVAGSALAMKPHRSHELVPVPQMPLAHPRICESGILTADVSGLSRVEIIAASAEDNLSLLGYVASAETSAAAVSAEASLRRLSEQFPALGHISLATTAENTQDAGANRSRSKQRHRRRHRAQEPDWGYRVLQGEPMIRESLAHSPQSQFSALSLQPQGFWQIHRGAPAALRKVVADMAQLRTGERVADLYAGAGLFTAWAAEAVGESGKVYSVEAAGTSSTSAQLNFANLPQVQVICADVEQQLAQLPHSEVVVVDPPRAGLSPKVVSGVVAMEPRALIYVSCEAASFARDARSFADQGWYIRSLELLDMYPNTHHMESVALLSR